MSSTIAAVCGVRLYQFAMSRGAFPACLPPFIVPSGDLLEARLPYEQMIVLWEGVMRAADDPAFPVLAGATATAHDYDAVGFACMTQPTLGEAVAQVVRYSRAWTARSEWRLERDPRTVSVIFGCPEPYRLGVRCATENVLAELHNAGRKLTGVEYPAARVRFRHAAPRDVSAHEAFFGGPIEWNADRNELTIADEMARLPLPKADPALAAYFDRHVQRLLEREPDAPERIARRVRAFLLEEVKRGAPTLQTAAAHLRTSPRTLKRRLQEEGTTFQDLLDAVRCDLAKRYLEEQRLALGEVSFLLGFSEPSAFHRAFKRWTGKTPLAYRQAPSAA
jgi:AraC-like DNA-binding protein